MEVRSSSKNPLKDTQDILKEMFETEQKFSQYAKDLAQVLYKHFLIERIMKKKLEEQTTKNSSNTSSRRNDKKKKKSGSYSFTDSLTENELVLMENLYNNLVIHSQTVSWVQDWAEFDIGDNKFKGFKLNNKKQKSTEKNSINKNEEKTIGGVFFSKVEESFFPAVNLTQYEIQFLLGEIASFYNGADKEKELMEKFSAYAWIGANYRNIIKLQQKILSISQELEAKNRKQNKVTNSKQNKVTKFVLDKFSSTNEEHFQPLNGEEKTTLEQGFIMPIQRMARMPLFMKTFMKDGLQTTLIQKKVEEIYRVKGGRNLSCN